jgi:putative SOS response-associated peptidase YedK
VAQFTRNAAGAASTALPAALQSLPMSSNFLAPTASELERDWGLVLDDGWQTDVAGGDQAPIIRRFGVGEAAQREAVLARFGLIPTNAKAARSPNSSLNARSETAATRSTFKNAFAHRQWCIIPAQCIYVPYYAEGAKRAERWRIRRNDRSPLCIAGLWDRWVDEHGREIVSFAMLTINCDLHPLLNRFDRKLNEKGEPAEKRTPVLLAEEDFDEWLDASPTRAPIYFGTFGKDDLDAEPAPSPTRRATSIMPLDTTISEF